MRKLMFVVLPTIAVSVFPVNEAGAVDAKDIASGLLKAYGPVAISTTTPGECHPAGCELVQIPVKPIQVACIAGEQQVYDCTPATTNTVKRVLSYGNIGLTLVGDIKFGDPVFHSIPDQVYTANVFVQNCTADYEKGSAHYQKTLTVTNTQSTTVTNSITNTTGFHFTLGYKSDTYGNYEGGINYSEAISNSTAQTNGVSSQWMDTNGIDVPNPKPHTAILGQIRAYRVFSDLPFSVTAIIDAPLERNDKGLATLASIAPQDKRTAEISGLVHLSGVAKSVTVFSDVPYDPSECQHAAPGEKKKVVFTPKNVSAILPKSARSYKSLDDLRTVMEK